MLPKGATGTVLPEQMLAELQIGLTGIQARWDQLTHGPDVVFARKLTYPPRHFKLE